jgi:pimeloyl-ACP methyl ester carboxylesterase
MVFFWQFPQRVERLALVSSGGLGREVSPLLRAAAVPGASGALWIAAQPRFLDALEGIGRRLDARGSARGVNVRAVVRALRPLQAPGARDAFLQTLRSVIDIRGQRVSARDRLYLLGSVPSLIVWGERDRTIPIEHGRAAHAEIPNSRFRTLPKAAHFPHLEDPEGLAAVLGEWLTTTAPHRIDDAEWSEVLESRTARRRHLRAA